MVNGSFSENFDFFLAKKIFLRNFHHYNAKFSLKISRFSAKMLFLGVHFWVFFSNFRSYDQLTDRAIRSWPDDLTRSPGQVRSGHRSGQRSHDRSVTEAGQENTGLYSLMLRIFWHYLIVIWLINICLINKFIVATILLFYQCSIIFFIIKSWSQYSIPTF